MHIRPIPLVLWLVVILGLVGCSGSVARAGLSAKQTPSCGSPAVAWRDVSARLTVNTPLRRISCRAIVQRGADSSVRVVLLADEGLLLLDLGRDASGIHLYQSIDGLRDSAAFIGEVVWQSWGNQHSSPGHWDDGIWVVDRETTRRWFGGDPLLLRRIKGQLPSVEVGDYRTWEGSLLAYQVRASGPGFSVTICLDHTMPTPSQATGLP